MRAPFVLTAYALSRGYRERLEEALGERPEYIHFAQLRRLPPRDLIRRLRALSGRRCLLPLEDPSSEAVLAMLQIATLLSRPASIEVVRPDLTHRRVPKLGAVSAGVALARVSLEGQLALLTARRELRRLLATPREELGFSGEGPILHLNPNLWLGLTAGGSVGHVAGVVNAFLAAGREVDVSAVTAPPLVRPEARFHRLPPPAPFGFPFEVNYYRFHRSAVRSLLALAPARRWGVVYQRLSVAGYAGVPVARACRIPLVVEYNGSEVWAAEHWGSALRYSDAARAAEEVSLRHAHLVVTVSEVLRDELLGRGVEPERIICHPNGVDPDVFAPERFDDAELLALRQELAIPADALVATFMGTFGHWHGVDVLAQAIRRLVDEAREWVTERRLHFLLVGDGLKMPVVRDTLSGRRYEHIVHLPGLVPQQEASRYLAASDILLSPHVPNPDGTRFFGSPTKLFEYMAIGRAILASDLGQIGAVLRPALHATQLPDRAPLPDAPERAVLAIPGDEDTLLAGIRFLVERSDWRAALGAAARSAALERYTWRAHVDAILAGMA